MTCYVYWYHLPEHSENTKEGYVGITSDLKTRHWYHSTRRTNQHLANAFNKYNSKILKEILFEGTREQCLLLESELRPEDNIGWNICKGGGDAPSWEGKQHSEETKQKISESNKGIPRPNVWKGKTGRYTEEHRKLIGSYHKGKTISEEHRRKISEKNSGINHARSEEITLIHKDNPNDELTFCNMREASEQLNINYPSLRSQVRRKSKSFNRAGYKVVRIGEE
jgi:group I intron endonuclease